MKNIDLSTEEFEVVEIKRSTSLSLVKIRGKLHYVDRDSIPASRRIEYYEARRKETLDGQS